MSTDESMDDLTPPLGVLSHRPGLPELAVRVGTQSTFLARMLEKAPALAPLARLNVFAEEDGAVAMLDACAAVLDTIAFYQERIANEGYLRTATERRSQIELARTVGYEPSAGVAATTSLCFTVDDTPSAPRRVPIPVGTRAQSVPGPGDTARSFETTEEIEARPEWNAMRPLSLQPQDVDIDADGRASFVSLDGIARVAIGSLHVTGPSQVRRGDVIAIVRAGRAHAAIVLDTHVDAERGVTTLTLDALAPERVPSLPAPRSLALPPTGVAPSSPRSLDLDLVREAIVDAIWDEDALQALLLAQGWSADDLLSAVESVLAERALGEGVVYAFRQRVGFFGNTAQPYAAVALAEVPQRVIVEQALAETPTSDISPWNAEARGRVAQRVVTAVANTAADPSKSWDANGGRTIWQADDGSDYASLGASVHLERVVAEASPTTCAVVEDRAPSGTVVRRVFKVASNRERALVGFRQQGRVSGLTLTRVDGSALTIVDRDPSFRFRTATAYVASEPLALAMLPITELVEEHVPGAAPRGAKTIVLDRMVLGLTRGRTIVVRGHEAAAVHGVQGVYCAESAKLVAARHEGGRTILHLDRNLEHRYVRSTMTLCANVAAATHGETVDREVLGSGRSEIDGQSFPLARTDLTYLRADALRGVTPSLIVRVNDEVWTRVSSFMDAPRNARVFTLRHDEGGRAVVAFGDGRHGARVPTGDANVTATYRSGVGSAGNVPAGAISIAVSRPLGVREVVNPLPARGGADPATTDEIRERAPRATTTLARTVSLRDFEDQARDFDGVARARAEAVWTGTSSVPFVTVSGPAAAAIPTGGDVHLALERLLRRSGDGRLWVRVGSYVPRLFGLDLLVWATAGGDLTRIAADVHAALAARFGFDARDLARPVTQADVFAAAQRVPGVAGASISRFRIIGSDATEDDAPPMLPAFGARWDRATHRVIPAELLLIDPASVNITIKTSTP